MDMFSHEIYSMNIDISTHHNIVKSVNWVYKMRRDNFIINATMTTELDPPVGNTISYANLNEAVVFQWVSDKVVIDDLKLAMTERMNEICATVVFNRLPPWNPEFNNHNDVQEYNFHAFSNTEIEVGKLVLDNSGIMPVDSDEWTPVK